MGHVPHQGQDFLPGLVQLFAVALNGGDNELVDVRGPVPGMAPGCQQAHLCVGPCPKAQPVKPAVCLSVLFQPDKAHGLILKAPCLDKPQGLRELGGTWPT